MLPAVSRDEIRQPEPPFAHEAYLAVVWSELRERRFPEAIGRIRAARVPGAEHATRALAWARLVDAAIARGGAGADLDAFLRENPELREADLLARHYSPERLASARARREFVLPDRSPLPHPAARRRQPDPREGERDAEGGRDSVRTA